MGSWGTELLADSAMFGSMVLVALPEAVGWTVTPEHRVFRGPYDYSHAEHLQNTLYHNHQIEVVNFFLFHTGGILQGCLLFKKPHSFCVSVATADSCWQGYVMVFSGFLVAFVSCFSENSPFSLTPSFLSRPLLSLSPPPFSLAPSFLSHSLLSLSPPPFSLAPSFLSHPLLSLSPPPFSLAPSFLSRPLISLSPPPFSLAPSLRRSQ